MVFQTEKAMEEAGDKIDANDKTAVEADLNALKDVLAKCANVDEITDAQVEEIKAREKEKLMQSAQKHFCQKCTNRLRHRVVHRLVRTWEQAHRAVPLMKRMAMMW